MSITASGSGDPAGMLWVERVDEDDPTVIVAGPVELALVRVLGAAADGGLTLTGTWDRQATPLLLASIR